MPRGVRGSAIAAGANASRLVTSTYLNEFRFMLSPVRLGPIFLHSLPRRNTRNRITSTAWPIPTARPDQRLRFGNQRKTNEPLSLRGTLRQKVGYLERKVRNCLRAAPHNTQS